MNEFTGVSGGSAAWTASDPWESASQTLLNLAGAVKLLAEAQKLALEVGVTGLPARVEAEHLIETMARLRRQWFPEPVEGTQA